MDFYVSGERKIYAVKQGTEGLVPTGSVKLERGPLNRFEELQEDNSWLENTDKKEAFESEQLRALTIKAEKEASLFKGVTVPQARKFIKGKYDEVRALPVSGADASETVSNISAKIDALIDACEFIDFKEAVCLLR